MGGRLLAKRARRRLVPPVQFQIISGTPMTLGFTHHLIGERQECRQKGVLADVKARAGANPTAVAALAAGGDAWPAPRVADCAGSKVLLTRFGR
jgi:hypothetical protein